MHNELFDMVNYNSLAASKKYKFRSVKRLCPVRDGTKKLNKPSRNYFFLMLIITNKASIERYFEGLIFNLP